MKVQPSADDTLHKAALGPTRLTLTKKTVALFRAVRIERGTSVSGGTWCTSDSDCRCCCADP